MRKVLKEMRCDVDVDFPFTYRLYYYKGHYLYRYDDDITENDGAELTQAQLHDIERRA